MSTKPTKTMSGAEFKQRFQHIIDGLGDDDQVSFGNGDLSFYRPKNLGPKEGPAMINIQFNEVYTVTADPDEA